MRALKNKHLGLVVLVLMMSIISLIISNEKILAAEVPKLTKKSLILEEGEKVTLALKKEIPRISMKWSSEDDYVATVSNKGVVKGIQEGETVITCKLVIKQNSKEKTYRLTCKVKVKKPKNTYSYRHDIDISDSNAYGASNYARVSPLQQFSYKDEGLAYAYLMKKNLYIITPTRELIINSKYSMLGDVISDEEGYFYVVWGEENNTDDASVKTTVISKYDTEGNEIKSTGFVGKSTPWGDSDSAKTKYPFHAGNCVSKIHDNILVCYHAKQRYDGHQCDQVIAVNTDTMEEYELPNNTYSGHSFNQDVIYCEKINDFLFASLGDCYSRGFRINRLDGEYGDDKEILFHTYLEANAGYNMWIVNETFAQLGGLDQTCKGVVLAGASVKALGEKAKKQKQNLFIQIFDPSTEGINEEMFVGGNKRTGKTAISMYDTELTSISDYGVIWLTDYTDRDVIAPQMITADNRIILMWNEKKNYTTEAFYMVLSESGKIITPKTSIGEVCLNSYEKPIYHNGKIYWAYSYNNIIKVKSIKI